MKSPKRPKAKMVKIKVVQVSASDLKAATDRMVKPNGWSTPPEYLRELTKELGLS